MLETQYERFLVVNNREIPHSGYFVAEELYRMLNAAFEERGYHKREKKSEETVTEEGITSFLELRPYKEMSHYVILMVKFKIHLKNVTNEVREIDGMKKLFQKGDVLVIIDAWYMTEFEGRWGQKPLIFFLKGIFNKLVYTFPTEAHFKGELVEDVAYFTAKIKRLLRSYREPEAALPPEEDVMKAVEEDVRRTLEEGGESREAGEGGKGSEGKQRAPAGHDGRNSYGAA